MKSVILACGIVWWLSAVAFAGSIVDPATNPFAVPGDAGGNPLPFTVGVSGFTAGSLVYVEQCDGTPATAQGWSPTLNCDLGSSPSAAIVAADGTTTFPAADQNHGFHPFKGPSPQGLFNCLSANDPSPNNGLPDFRSCQIRVSTSNAGITADQAFLGLQLPDAGASSTTTTTTETTTTTTESTTTTLPGATTTTTLVVTTTTTSSLVTTTTSSSSSTSVTSSTVPTTTSTTLPACSTADLPGALCAIDALTPSTFCAADEITPALVDFLTGKLASARAFLAKALAKQQANAKPAAIHRLEGKAEAKLQQIVPRLGRDAKHKKLSDACRQTITDDVTPLHDRIQALRTGS